MESVKDPILPRLTEIIRADIQVEFEVTTDTGIITQGPTATHSSRILISQANESIKILAGKEAEIWSTPTHPTILSTTTTVPSTLTTKETSKSKIDTVLNTTPFHTKLTQTIKTIKTIWTIKTIKTIRTDPISLRSNLKKSNQTQLHQKIKLKNGRVIPNQLVQLSARSCIAKPVGRAVPPWSTLNWHGEVPLNYRRSPSPTGFSITASQVISINANEAKPEQVLL